MFSENVKLTLMIKVTGVILILLNVPPELESAVRVTRQKDGSRAKGRQIAITNKDIPNNAANVFVRSMALNLGRALQKPESTKELEGFTFIASHLSSNFYLSKEKATKEEAIKKCQELKGNNLRYDLATLEAHTGDLQAVTDKLNDTATEFDETYINAVVRDKDGKRYLVYSGIYGEKMIDAGTMGESIRSKRSARLVSYAEQSVPRKTRQASPTAAPVAPGPPAPGAPAPVQPAPAPPNPAAPAAPAKPAAPDGASASGGIFVTLIETLFPWTVDWKSESTHNCDPTLCEPTLCEVKTAECTSTPQTCSVRTNGSCQVLESEGCSMICEDCQISKPSCHVIEPKCIIVRDRICTASEPNCTIVTPNCTATREECTTQQPSCDVRVNNSPECITPDACLTEQGKNCTMVERDCSANETFGDRETCFFEECRPMPICIKPDYCRLSQVICPPIQTFCPPETVKCPPPTITCGEPEITCEEPKYYCPPPQVVCSRPLINCTAPVIKCANVLTTCSNPDILCPPPVVTCPPPNVTCTPPKNPCPVHEIPNRPCVKECKDDCKCVKLKKDASNKLNMEQTDCNEKLLFICEGAPTSAAKP